MKTSNRILLGLLIIIFTVPFVLAATLKAKVKKGEYTVVKSKNPGSDLRVHSGSFTEFKVVNIVAPGPGFLTCHLKQSDTMSYTYNQHSPEDSMVVLTSNDTLLIKYISTNEVTGDNGERERSNVTINVNLRAFHNLLVDGAVVVLDSLPASSGSLSVTLRNKGVIKDGTSNRHNPDGTKPAVGIKNEKALQESSVYDAELPKSMDKIKTGVIQNANFAMLNVNIKDLLVFHLL